MTVAYLPHVSPQNNNTQQIRRRVDDLVDTVTNQVGSVATNTGDLGSLNTAVQTKAPTVSPTFQNSVSLSGVATHTSATTGAATALPANPLGYVTLTINGQQVKLPYYKP